MVFEQLLADCFSECEINSVRTVFVNERKFILIHREIRAKIKFVVINNFCCLTA